MFRNPLKKLDQENMRRSSEILKKQRDDNKIINIRLRISAVVVCMVFALIGGRLVYIQYQKNDEYKTKLENFTSKKQRNTTPRGVMKDANGNIVVNTIQSLNITFYPPENLDDDELWDLAIRFTKQFGKGKYEPTDDEWKSLYLQVSTGKNGKLDKGNHLLSDDEYEKAMKGAFSTDEVDALKKERVTQENIDAIDADKKEAYGNWLLMTTGQANVSKVILENVNNEQASYLSEHKDEFNGFDLTSGWTREYPYGDTLRDVFGNIGTIQQEDQLYYQALGYSLNENVGTSGLELQYEDLLSGTRTVNDISYDDNGNAIFSESSPGKKGYNLQLSIDMELQQKVDQILENVLSQYQKEEKRRYFKDLYVVLMNPSDGRIYVMSGIRTNSDGTHSLYSAGNYMSAQMPGSIVKGATIYMGLNEGVISESTVFNDAPMYFKGGLTKQSYNNYGPLNAVGALQKSSNVYMFNLVIKLAGGSYIPYGPLNLNLDTFNLMRYYYSMFGLGTSTGIDLPKEETGFKGYGSSEPGLLLDFSIGQLDSYTPLQMAQYASTVANNGVRVKPRLVSGAYEVNSETVLVDVNKAENLSVVQGNLGLLSTTQKGFRACSTSGNCGVMRTKSYNPASKTGTAEVKIKDETTGIYYDGSNAALIGYAPYESPKVAFSCVAPQSSVGAQVQPNICSNVVMGQVLDEFFNKYPQ